MPLDPNIILQGKAPQINPMEIAQNATALQTGMNQNRLFASDFAARQAIGEHVRAATDKTTGETDYNKVMGGVSTDPRSAFRAPEVAKDFLERKKAQAELTGLQVKQFNDHLGATAAAINPLIASKEPLTTDAVVSAAVNVINNPSLPPELRTQVTNDVTGFLSKLPPNATDAQIRSALQQVQLQTMDTQERFNAIYGAPQVNDTGPTIAVGTLSPMTGYHPVGQIDKGLSPADLAAPRQVGVGVGGVPMMSTTADFLKKAAEAGGGGIPMGLPAGEAEAQTQSAGRVKEIQDYAAGAPQRLVAMQSVRSLIPTAPGTAFGPTGQLTSQIQKVLAGLGVQWAASDQAPIDEISKGLEMIVSHQQQAMGAGTDASRATVKNANPTLANSKEGLLQNLSVVEGNDRFMVAKNRALQKHLLNNPASSTPRFEAAFNEDFTPLALQVQTMPKAEQKRVWESLSGKQDKDGNWTGEKGRFLRTLRVFQKQGWLEGQ